MVRDARIIVERSTELGRRFDKGQSLAPRYLRRLERVFLVAIVFVKR